MFNANPNIGILDPLEAKTVKNYLFRNQENKQEDFQKLPKQKNQ